MISNSWATEIATAWRHKAKDRSLKAKEKRAKVAKRLRQQEAVRDAGRRDSINQEIGRQRTP